MESLLKQFSQGVLSDLENLDVAAKDRKRARQQYLSEKKSLHQLEKKVKTLERRKHELQRKLKIAEHNLTCEGEETRDETVKSDEVTDSVARLTKLTEIADLYRLTGISVDSVGENEPVVLRFDTSCEGQFVKAYFVEVDKNWNQRVLHHTLPGFIPVVDLATRSDLQTFVSKIREYLFAFTSRQTELMALQRDCSAIIRGEIESSFAVDYIRMTMTPFEDAFPVKVTLAYDSLMDVLPSSVILKPVISDCENVAEPSHTLLQHWTELFTTLSLTEAVSKIVSMEVQAETSDFTSEL
ncbi:centromere protein O-like [Gigantopelta aegis]|uniref:centromere protein O-like n=1 Tax=Gigantopelta aegis TaxID=1735272 RepID=UPI001B88B8D6|nr:centromere protein O-like [Gigantopelta aegis]